jgi:hypothetical protein
MEPRVFRPAVADAMEPRVFRPAVADTMEPRVFRFAVADTMEPRVFRPAVAGTRGLKTAGSMALASRIGSCEIDRRRGGPPTPFV